MENRRLFGLMCYVNREMERRNSENLSSFGISGAQLQTLVYVHRCTLRGEKVCQRDVERELNLRASSVSTLLAGLTSCGYVTRAFAEGDARTKFIELTPKGEQLCLKNRELMDKCDAIIQDALTEEEQVQFKELLIKIFNHIKG
ncbi:MAG TPA: winged helix-turn-helix transcriptional regulator [Candidatus Coproplasma stercorigallinarum]|nr:winged helix-turn-helix transcriptional regulator [Candidatus Coproplasma stercorigallinarum]